MDVTQATERKTRRAAEHTAQSTVMQATQMLRQFHRIGKSRSAGCRKALLRLLGEQLRDLRVQLVRTTVEALGGAADSSGTTALVSDALDSVAARFAADFGDLLSTMDGFTDRDVADVLRHQAEEIGPALEEAALDRGRQPLAPAMDFVSDPHLRRVATTLSAEACRCVAAEAHTSAALTASAALGAVLQDVLTPAQATPALGRPADLLLSAVTRCILPGELIDEGEWLTAHRHLLDPVHLLQHGSPVEPGDATKVLDLLEEVCALLRDVR